MLEPERSEYYTHETEARQVIVSVNKQNGVLTTIIRVTMLFGERDATSTH